MQRCHCQEAEAQPWTSAMWESGEAAEVGFGVLNGTAERGVASAEGNGSVWESASGPAVSAAGEGTADRPAAAGGETDEGVNLAASVALEPGVSVMVVLRSLMWADSLHRCKGKVLPQGSEVLSKTNLMEAPGNTAVNSCEYKAQHNHHNGYNDQ